MWTGECIDASVTEHKGNSRPTSACDRSFVIRIKCNDRKLLTRRLENARKVNQGYGFM